MKKKNVIVAVDGTGGDNDSTRNIVGAALFALTLYPHLKLIIFGSEKLEDGLKKARLPDGRWEFRLAPLTIPQDETPRKVLEGYSNAAMRQAIECVKNQEADAMVSSGGTGPLVTLSRHILGTAGKIRPALCAKMPSGPGRFSLMLDLGANSSFHSSDLYDFARLGSAAARISLNIGEPRISVLNVGSEQGKGNAVVREARDLIRENRHLYCQGFIEANRIFSGDTDVIVTDGFTGNVALKAAEGVARIFGQGAGLRKFFARLARPEWLMPWQYNGSLLLGVRGIVVKGHASAAEQSVAVAMVEAARAAEKNLSAAIEEELSSS